MDPIYDEGNLEPTFNSLLERYGPTDLGAVLGVSARSVLRWQEQGLPRRYNPDGLSIDVAVFWLRAARELARREALGLLSRLQTVCPILEISVMVHDLADDRAEVGVHQHSKALS